MSRNVALFMITLILALVADGVVMITISWQILRIYNSPADLSLIWTGRWGAILVGALGGGWLADRHNKARVLAASTFFRAVAALAIAVSVDSGENGLWLLWSLVSVYYMAYSVFGPASAALIPVLSKRHHLLKANAFRIGLRPIAAFFVGPALGGLLVSHIGIGSTTLVAGGLSFIAAIAASLISLQMPVERAAVKISDALKYVTASPWLLIGVLGSFVAYAAFFGPYQTLLPYLVLNRYRGNAVTLGAIYAIGSCGSILGSIVVASQKQKLTLWFPFAIRGIGIAITALFAIVSGFWSAAAVAFVTGLCFQIGTIHWSTFMQQQAPRPVLGRVLSFDLMSFAFAATVSATATGPLAERFSVETVVIIGALTGAMTMLIAGLWASREFTTENRHAT